MIKCSKCGGVNVQVAMWVNPNTEEIHDDFGSWNHEDTKWCADCGEHVLLIMEPDNDNEQERGTEPDPRSDREGAGAAHGAAECG